MRVAAMAFAVLACGSSVALADAPKGAYLLSIVPASGRRGAHLGRDAKTKLPSCGRGAERVIDRSKPVRVVYSDSGVSVDGRDWTLESGDGPQVVADTPGRLKNVILMVVFERQKQTEAWA